MGDRVAEQTGLYSIVLAAALVLASPPALADPAMECAERAASPFEAGYGHHPQRIPDARAAVDICLKALAADPQSPDISAWLGRAYSEAFEDKAAIAHLKVGAAGGNAVARALHANYLLDGKHVASEPERAVSILAPLAQQGLAPAQLGLGRAYDFGFGVEVDAIRAVEYYRLAAMQGYPRAQSNLASMYELGLGVEVDFAEALRLNLLAAAQNDPYGHYNLGLMHEFGRGVPQDYVEAARHLERAAALGDRDAINQLGHYASEGLGGELNYGRALQLFERAGDHPLAIANLAILYLYGRGVATDEKRAAELFRRAAEMGEPTAMTNLGNLLVEGQGVAIDYNEALVWTRKAAELDQPMAWNNLGNHYEKGLGVARDLKLARQWYQRAADAGMELALKGLADVAKLENGAP